MGRRLLAHPYTHALLRAKDGPLTAAEALEAFPDASAWRAVAGTGPADRRGRRRPVRGATRDYRSDYYRRLYRETGP